MKKLITKIDEYIYLTNDLTREMDTFLLSNIIKEDNSFRTYLYSYNSNMFLIRYPGSTRGNLEIDDNMIIKKITLYDDNDIYKSTVIECFDKYIGMKLVIE